MADKDKDPMEERLHTEQTDRHKVTEVSRTGDGDFEAAQVVDTRALYGNPDQPTALEDSEERD